MQYIYCMDFKMTNIKFDKLYTYSNYISFLRIVLIIPTMYLLANIEEHEHYRYFVLIMFILAYISDLLDGYLARKFNDISELGKIIDPLADKIFVLAIVIQLYVYGEVSSFYFWVIILRDVIIFIGGIIISNIIGKVLPSNLIGKITVASIGFFFIAVVAGASEVPWLYNSLQYLSLALSFASVFAYALRGYESIKWYKRNGIT